MLPLEVRSGESVANCVKAVLERAGRLDVLVNNAGYVLGGAIEETALEEARGQFETNFFGLVRMVEAVLPIMRSQGGGRIINISSLAGLSAVPFLGFYSASKFRPRRIQRGPLQRGQAVPYPRFPGGAGVREDQSAGGRRTIRRWPDRRL